MAKVKNPNAIVDELVQDYSSVFGDSLECVIMYGSAVTHEYTPGVSDIDIAVVLTDNTITHIARCIPIQKKWIKMGVSTPLFMTAEYIRKSLDTYPIEFLDMQSNYRVLHGDDLFMGLEINREHLRHQCERELKGVAIHLRKGYVRSLGNPKELHALLETSLSALFPVFKAILVLSGRAIPSTRSDIVSAIEDFQNFGVSALSDIMHADAREIRKRYERIFEDYTGIVDSLVVAVGGMPADSNGS